jgi:hypothetical protein
MNFRGIRVPLRELLAIFLFTPRETLIREFPNSLFARLDKAGWKRDGIAGTGVVDSTVDSQSRCVNNSRPGSAGVTRERDRPFETARAIFERHLDLNFASREYSRDPRMKRPSKYLRKSETKARRHARAALLDTQRRCR